MRSRTLLVLLLLVVAALFAWWSSHDDDTRDGGPVERASEEDTRHDMRTEDPSLHGTTGAEASLPAAATPDQATTEAPEERPGRMRGHVVDANRRPLRDVVVFLGADGDPPFPMDYTDEDGAFELKVRPGSAHGEHLLGARHVDGRATYVPIAVPTAPFDMDVGDLILAEGAVIRGTVVDETGAPLEHVRVRAYTEQGLVVEAMHAGRRVMIGCDDVLTDSGGHFTMRGLPPDPHRVWVDLLLRSDLAAEPTHVTGVHPGGPPLQFVLRKARAYRGTVTDRETGAPVLDFLLNYRRVQGTAGRFELAPIDMGGLTIHALGYLPWHLSEEKLSARPIEDPIEVRLVRDLDAGSLRIAVLDAEGARVPGWKATLTTNPLVIWSIDGGKDREHVVTGLPPARYRVDLQAPGWTLAGGWVEVEKRREARFEARLERGGEVHLVVRDEQGEDLGAVDISLRDAEGNPVVGRWRYDEPQGTLLWVAELRLLGRIRMTSLRGRLDGLRAGRYVLRIHRAVGHRDVELEVPTSGTREIEVRLGEEMGR